MDTMIPLPGATARTEPDPDHSLPSSTEVEKDGAISPFPPIAFMAGSGMALAF
jgi:hypothetical protein